MRRIERPVLIALTAPGFEIKLSAVPPRDLDMLSDLGFRAAAGKGAVKRVEILYFFRFPRG